MSEITKIFSFEDPTDLIELDPSTNPTCPCSILLTLDKETEEIDVIKRMQIEGTPIREFEGKVLVWCISEDSDATEIEDWVDENIGLFEKVLVSEDPDNDLYYKIQDKLYNEIPKLSGDSAGWWSAGDWLQYADEVSEITKDSTDEELEKMADSFDEEAKSENVIIFGTYEYLVEVRDEKIEEYEYEKA